MSDWKCDKWGNRLCEACKHHIAVTFMKGVAVCCLCHHDRLVAYMERRVAE